MKTSRSPADSLRATELGEHQTGHESQGRHPRARLLLTVVGPRDHHTAAYGANRVRSTSAASSND